jgi:SAM-dependent methyltransferase
VSDAETLKIYASKAAEYAELTAEANTRDPSLAAFIDAVSPGGRVLDLGCGPGTSAAVMVRAGLQVDAFDPVPEMVALARAHPGVSVHQAGFDDLDADQLYNGVWANFSLLHAARVDMPLHLAKIARALKPGGRFHIAVKTGTGSHRDSLGRLYTYYSDAELTGLLNDAGFSVLTRRTGNDPGLSGESAPWIALGARLA